MHDRFARRARLLALALFALFTLPLAAQEDEVTLEQRLAGLELRTIGPAFMSGRIADIAIHPEDDSTWYVAVGSGGVWKTTNSGTTWESLFDGQPSYSIGSIVVDENNPNTIWVGTGENVGGRHVGYGDGIYVSHDGGASWASKGLEDSERISTIIIHPDDSDTLWVAVQGPLWSPGGQRGLYMTTDGGESWERTLVGDEGDDVWTGVTDVVIDPRDPDVLYAATWQRHRTVAAYMGGGPNSGVHKSTDGGRTWTKLGGGLPGGNLGKIGLAISPQNPDVVYAAIETKRREGGIWRSTDRGASWRKMSDRVAGGTGPHYYQELYASPHAFDRIYLMDVQARVSHDGGATWENIDADSKHVDNHALAFRDDDPDYMLWGTDGGLYETFDHAETWRYIDNLPVTQFYKVAVDDAEPFYHVYGGTQDNNTQGGPSRTDNVHGVRNADWYVVLFGDGHQPATEPGNPDIMYAQWQQGNLVRFDRTTGEIVYVQPQPEPGDDPERWNWDAPILVSPHDPTTIFHASQRVWRSDDRGDSWRPISGDLTRNQTRIELDLMGRQWSWDASWDLFAMSKYNTITSLAQSPIDENILYAGTDDGLIQVTTDGGETWREIEVGDLPGVPDLAFVNDIKADLFDADTVYVALDNHKYGDFAPYLLKSTDRGRRWTSIADDLPERHLVWRVVQDHVDPELMFAGTEFGVFVTLDGGEEWTELTGNAPNISYRDLAIQRRENDLVGATFGRGFWLLDDYSPLRGLDDDTLAAEATLFDTRRAWWYIPQGVLGMNEKGSQGDGLYTAENPPFGAVFTYHLADGYTTDEQDRQAREKPLIAEGEDVPFPGWDALEAEVRQPAPTMLLTVRDADGNVVRRLEGPASRGFHRVAWDLSLPSPMAIGAGGGFGMGGGFMVAPGRYTVELAKRIDGAVTPLDGPKAFDVVRMREGALDGAEPEETAAFWKRLSEMQRRTTAAGQVIGEARAKIDSMQQALGRSQAPAGDLDAQLYRVDQALYEIAEQLEGKQTMNQVGELQPPTIGQRMFVAMIGTGRSTYGPTPTHVRSLEIAESEFAEVRAELERLVEQRIPALEQALEDAGAPWTPGAPIPD
ncbi:glycosyl hydrolase [Wenzhouxiangella sp. XN79A]|uniref:VPS10 domain-containing protein n=1 Tax=Wenzhouxiangella sp. XN79A TaxID=2724193 RepID=UPI00144A5794|nr:glycosyl hydrolase [Wenzhouxiangella sp. XN79A]NKI33863.1 glycosyl hydrolase [Wenzhouxiangella sp. XN79A]